MAAATVCDKGVMLDTVTDSLTSRTRYTDALYQLPIHSRDDRWSVNLSTLGGSNRTGRKAVNRSLIMPVSTGSHSLLTSTTTLPSVLESNDHARLASYNLSASSSSQGRSLRPQPQSSAVNVAQGAFRPSWINDSANSSPSTTSSTLNSAITETSPVSSPQSPNSLLHSPFRQQKEKPSNRLTTDGRYTGMEQVQDDDVSPVRPSTSMSDSAALRKGRQMKNMKNLMINTNGISAKQNIDSKADKNDPPRPATQAGPAAPFKPGNLPAVSESAPASPSFIIPKMPPRRKPSKLGLTISTPDTDQKAVVPPTPGFGTSFAARHGTVPKPLQSIPQTPAFPPALSFQRSAPNSDNILSPSLGPPQGMSFPAATGKELRTPGLAPLGGMTLPPFGSVESSPGKRSSPGPERRDRYSIQKQRSMEIMDNSSEIVNHTISYTNSIPASDRPLSQEVKSPSYPEGPACIYPPNVFLYHQPTAEEARDFDVIINVAREVTNPFEIEAEEEKARRHAKNTEPVRPSRPSYRSVGVQTELLTEDYPPRNKSGTDVPDSAASEISFHDALERLDVTIDEETPATPKATRFQPEYIHLPWEHNSKVYEEWFEICKLIDERTKQGKRVLIHCQLGVSRSASLIVAYGIYLNPNLRPDEAREQAKSRSRWIDLNMHFMYELGDFKKLLQQKGVNGAQAPKAVAGHSAKLALAAPGLKRSKTDSGMLSPVLSMPPTPMSAVSDLSSSVALSSDESKEAQLASEVSTPSYATFGPSSAPAEVGFDPVKSAADTNGPTAHLATLPTRTKALPTAQDHTKLPAPAEVPQRQPSPALRTPGFADMPGGWARTPADSRPTSMVFPGSSAAQGFSDGKTSEKTPTQLSPAPSYVSSIHSNDDKPKRPASFRGLPRMPSFGSGLSSLGSFFLKRSSSSASKTSRTSSPIASETAPSFKRRTSTQAISSSSNARGDLSPSSDLKKPPSLPSLRTMFSGSPTPHKPALNVTLEPIPQSAVGQGPTENELAEMMSPRAQEFTPAPFMRPTTSHHAMTGLTMDQHRKAEGQASGGRKRQSLSLEEMNALNATNAAVNHLTIAGMKRAGSEASTRKSRAPQPIISTDDKVNGLGNALDSSVRELMSPGAQERDPRSPPSHGVLAKEERVMPSIDDIL